MTVKIELGFTESGVGGPFFTLDDPVLGRLDNPNAYLGGGEIFVDVTEYFMNYSLQRGKSRELDRFQAGQATVQFENNLRTFDPTYELSPFFGQIVPKRNIRITNGTAVQFLGIVEDWNIRYEPGGQSIASCVAFDAFSYLANVELSNVSFAEERTVTRINNVLDAIGWSTAARDISLCGATLSAGTVTTAVPVLNYLQLCADSDPGDLFIARDGDLKFAGRNTPADSSGPVFTDTGTAIPYMDITAIYGSELLYNDVTVVSTIGTATAQDTSSVIEYGARELTRQTLLSSEEQLNELADYLVVRYGNPEYRFEGVSVELKDVTPEQKAQLLNLELSDVVKVEFTPNKIGDPIERYGKVIGITQNVGPFSEQVTYKLETIAGTLFVLDDPVFGRLDAGNLLGW